MDSPRIDQSLSELTFFIFRRSLHPELFSIHRSRQFFQGDYEVIIWITDCGHVVSVFSGRHCITELICPADQMLPKRGLVQQFPFRGEKSHKCSWSDDLGYMVNFQVESMSVNLYRQCYEDFTNAGKKRGIFISFPQWAKGDLIPFSYLDYEARREELQLHAYHAFPEQQRLLKTQSLFGLSGK
jgi:hypothetical protein